MIVKQCQFPGRDDQGTYIHLVHPGYDNEHLVKEAAASLPQLEQIQKFLKGLSRQDGVLYALVSALGAGEYWGSNSNGDYFSEEALLHSPPGWHELPYDQQKLQGARWSWGYPTFYNAHAFQHHVNKDPARAFGEVEYVMWDPFMKRVLLVIGFSRRRATEMGAIGVLDRIENGEYPDVSMGCRVPYDVCSICADWSRITKNAKVDLAEHKRRPITGMSTVTREYCQHLTNELNRIYPDGRQVKMLNIHPKFFDLSVVFIGADKTSKILAKLAAGQCPIRHEAPMCKKGCTQCSPDHAIASGHVHDVWDREKAAMEKTAEEDALLKEAFGLEEFEEDPADERDVSNYFRKVRGSGPVPMHKRAEIVKRIRSNFSGKAIPALEATEPDIPKDVQDDMSRRLSDALSTAGGMGMVIKPREFQRMYIRAIGNPDLADDLDDRGLRFRMGRPPADDFRLSGSIVPAILSALRPLLGGRSAFGRPLHKRTIVVIQCGGVPKREESAELDHPLLDKVGSAYSAYRRDLIYKVAGLANTTLHENPWLLPHLTAGPGQGSFSGGIAKAGGSVLESMIGMLPTAYLNEVHTTDPISGYVREHCDLAGLTKAAGLAMHSGVA